MAHMETHSLTVLLKPDACSARPDPHIKVKENDARRKFGIVCEQKSLRTNEKAEPNWAAPFFVSNEVSSVFSGKAQVAANGADADSARIQVSKSYV